MKRDSRLVPWIATLLLVAAGLLPLWKAVNGGYDAGTLPGIFLGVASILAIFAVIDTLNKARLRVLRHDNPDAFVSNVAIYRPLPEQLREVQNLLGVSPGNVRASSYVSICVDADMLRFYGGAWRPRVLAALPVAKLIDVRLETRTQGKWNLACIELDFGSSSIHSSLDLTLMTTRWGLPRVASLQSRKDAVERLISIRASADKSGDRD
ncbi:hypothetical protein [Lacisediminihabitans sp. H27-G8]|uniref:hypothetical protein n=1 Tax=Lacisediminihabitans sp. H27-G8 TaxID=3111909 RepID=UPI0038FCBB3A